jgi:hypothetical protein
LTAVIAAHRDRGAKPEGALSGALEHLRRSVKSAVTRPHIEAATVRRCDAVLQAAIAAGMSLGLAPIAAALVALPQRLPWDYQYQARPGKANLAERIGTTRTRPSGR